MSNKKRYSTISIALIAISGAIALLSNFGASRAALDYLLISQPGHAGLQDVLSGQFWRLITPVFIHFGIMHFVFNMLWVWDLGKAIETRKGVWFYIGFVVVVGSVSNVAQYLLTGSPFFGGMSGVVYGLFGYIWIKGRSDPAFGAALHKTTVIMMLAWFVLCWTGLLGPIANWAHTIGLALGAAWGFVGGKSSRSGMSSVAKVPLEEKLEYLSTVDMLQIETRRQWVRDHYSSDARHKYDTVNGKLDIIDTIIGRQPSSFADSEHSKSLDIAFGDALVQETGARWAMLESAQGRMPVLIMADSHTDSQPGKIIIHPLIGMLERLRNTPGFNLRHGFEDAVQSLRNGTHHA